jgi:hypothetical protein
MFNDPHLDPAMTNPMMNDWLIEGTPVFDLNGEKVGDVSEHGIQQGKLVIHRELMKKDVYLPLGCITHTGQNGLYLNIGKDEMKDLENVGPMTATKQPADIAPRGTVGSVGIGHDAGRTMPGVDLPQPPSQPTDTRQGTTGIPPMRDGDGAMNPPGEDVDTRNPL